jgi:uracil-DNA glycosylase family 4
MQSELSSLIADVKENILYLQELGVSDMRADVDALKSGKPVAATVAAAAKKEEPMRVPPPSDLVTGGAVKKEAPAASSSTLSLKEKLETTKLSNFSAPERNTTSNSPTPVEKPVAKKAVSDDTLFGDISPAIELAPTIETLDDVHRSLNGCKLCRLWEGRTQIVNSTGNLKAKLMFIGEAPGADEDAQGKPFVGRAGQLLTKIIEAMGMDREEVFIGNINRCRPPGNRAPMADEAATCKPFLLREIAVVKPKAIVVLGATAMQNLLETKAPIGKLRGNFQDYFGIKVMPTFHPAYLLRDPHKKREVWEDMKKVKSLLESL